MFRAGISAKGSVKLARIDFHTGCSAFRCPPQSPTKFRSKLVLRWHGFPFDWHELPR